MTDPALDEALRALIEDQQVKLVRLAEDILVNKLGPADLFIVLPAGGRIKRYIVVEGNRRLAAMRLVTSPELADGTPLRARFGKLASRAKDLPKRAMCVVMRSVRNAPRAQACSSLLAKEAYETRRTNAVDCLPGADRMPAQHATTRQSRAHQYRAGTCAGTRRRLAGC